MHFMQLPAMQEARIFQCKHYRKHSMKNQIYVSVMTT